MSNIYGFKQRIIDVFKNYSAYIISCFILVVLSAIIILAIVFSGTKEVVTNEGNVNVENNVPNTPDVSAPVGSVITYSLPLLNATIAKGYYDKELVYNDSLKQWETHRSMDFVSTDSNSVMSIADGVVKSVYSNYLEGNVVVITHDGGLESHYASLSDDISVKVGDKVSSGQVIATASDSAYSELNTGAHLHFTLFDEGVKVDPMAYLNIQDK